MAFDEIEFPRSLSVDLRFSPGLLVDRVVTRAKVEFRDRVWSQDNAVFRLGLNNRSADDVHAALVFLRAREYSFRGFRLWNPLDYKSCAPLQTAAFDDVVIGTGDGVTTDFQLIKTHISGAQTFSKKIVKPIAGTVLIGINGAAQGSGWTVNTVTGLVSFSVAPGDTLPVTAGFHWNYPVTLATESADLLSLGTQVGAIPDMRFEELKL